MSFIPASSFLSPEPGVHSISSFVSRWSKKRPAPTDLVKPGETTSFPTFDYGFDDDYEDDAVDADDADDDDDHTGDNDPGDGSPDDAETEEDAEDAPLTAPRNHHVHFYSVYDFSPDEDDVGPTPPTHSTPFIPPTTYTEDEDYGDDEDYEEESSDPSAEGARIEVVRSNHDSPESISSITDASTFSAPAWFHLVDLASRVHRGRTNTNEDATEDDYS